VDRRHNSAISIESLTQELVQLVAQRVPALDRAPERLRQPAVAEQRGQVIVVAGPHQLKREA